MVLKIYKFENYIFECVRLSTLARFNVKGNKNQLLRRTFGISSLPLGTVFHLNQVRSPVKVSLKGVLRRVQTLRIRKVAMSMRCRMEL